MKSGVKCFGMWWPGTELNRRRQPFQGCALPPELPGHVWAHSLSAGAGRVVGHARTWTELPVSAGSQEAGSVSNSHDYSNGVGFAQIVAAGFARRGRESAMAPLRTENAQRFDATQ